MIGLVSHPDLKSISKISKNVESKKGLSSEDHFVFYTVLMKVCHNIAYSRVQTVINFLNEQKSCGALQQVNSEVLGSYLKNVKWVRGFKRK